MRGSGAAWCRCRVDASDTVTVGGSGNPDDPYRFDVRLNADEENEMQDTSEGLLMRTPAAISAAIGFEAARSNEFVTLDSLEPAFGIKLSLDDVISRIMAFPQVVFDTGGMFNTSDNGFTVPRTGVWDIGTLAGTLDTNVWFFHGIIADNLQCVLRSGPYYVGSGAECVTIAHAHIELTAGQVLRQNVGSDVEDLTVHEANFWAFYLGA